MVTIVAERAAHIFERELGDHYVEPEWISQRLFDVEPFTGPILDPCCGWGRILQAAARAGYEVMASDIANRGCAIDGFREADFLNPAPDHLRWTLQAGSLVTNPPFDRLEECSNRAVALLDAPGSAITKVAFVFPIRRLPAARWLSSTPLHHIWMLTPRPSMPTGEHIRNGGKVGGGTQDFAWLVWARGYTGAPAVLGWLHREPTTKPPISLCPQLAKADMRVFRRDSGFDPKRS
jgi:hypothetical protein